MQDGVFQITDEDLVFHLGLNRLANDMKVWYEVSHVSFVHHGKVIIMDCRDILQ
jgi:hypothetical protein